MAVAWSVLGSSVRGQRRERAVAEVEQERVVAVAHEVRRADRAGQVRVGRPCSEDDELHHATCAATWNRSGSRPRPRIAAPPEPDRSVAVGARDPVALVEAERERVGPVRVRSGRHPPTAEIPVQGHDRLRGVGLVRGLAQAADVDLERHPGVHERPEDGLVQLRRRAERRRLDVAGEVPLHEIEVTEGIEEPAPRGGEDLVEVGRAHLPESPSGTERRDAIGLVRRVRPDVHRADREVVGVAPEMVADRVLVPATPRSARSRTGSQGRGRPTARPRLARRAGDRRRWRTRRPAGAGRNRRGR